MTETIERMLPLYEGKMGLQYDHRFASFKGIGDTDIEPNEEQQDERRLAPVLGSGRSRRRSFGPAGLGLPVGAVGASAGRAEHG